MKKKSKSSIKSFQRKTTFFTIIFIVISECCWTLAGICSENLSETLVIGTIITIIYACTIPFFVFDFSNVWLSDEWTNREVEKMYNRDLKEIKKRMRRFLLSLQVMIKCI